jgi:hypothetical protein
MTKKLGLLVVVFFWGCATPEVTFTPIKYSVEDTGYKPGKGWYQQPRCYRRGP